MKKICLFLVLLFFFNANTLCCDEYLKKRLSEENLFLRNSIEKAGKEGELRKKRYEDEILDLEKRIMNLEKELKSGIEMSVNKDAQNDYISNLETREKNFSEKMVFYSQGLNKDRPFEEIADDFFNTSLGLRSFDLENKKIIIAGFICGIYKKGNESGFVKFNEKGIGFIENIYYKKEIDSFFDNKTKFFPLIFGKDIKMETDLFFQVKEYLLKGGIMIWPIILTGFTGVLLSFFQGWLLFRSKIPSMQKEERFFSLIKSGEIPSSGNYKKYPSLFPIAEVFKKNDNSIPSSELVESFFDKYLAGLEKFIPTIGVLAGIAPLVGLLGTVTGMIMTFNAAGGEGAARAAEMATGISEALITTQLGLSIALPLMVVHHIFEQRVDKFAFDMDEKKNMFLGLIKDNDIPE